MITEGERRPVIIGVQKDKKKVFTLGYWQILKAHFKQEFLTGVKKKHRMVVLKEDSSVSPPPSKLVIKMNDIFIISPFLSQTCTDVVTLTKCVSLRS